MKYGYIRVSSKSQKDNYSIQEQRDLVLAAGADEVIEEVYTGGKVYDRPKFDNLIKRLQAGDTLIVCKLDRFARTVVEGGMLAQELYDKNISLNILNMGIKKQMEQLPYDLKAKYSLDQVQQSYAGWLAYEDMCAKYAPDYVKFSEGITHRLNHYSPVCFSLIARAMTRKEAYKQGFKPSHIENMNCQFYNAKLYFYTGCSGVGMEEPSEYSYESLDRENPFKYLTEYSLNNKIYYARI